MIERRYQRKYRAIDMMDALLVGCIIGMLVTMTVGGIAVWVV